MMRVSNRHTLGLVKNKQGKERNVSFLFTQHLILLIIKMLWNATNRMHANLVQLTCKCEYTWTDTFSGHLPKIRSTNCSLKICILKRIHSDWRKSLHVNISVWDLMTLWFVSKMYMHIKVLYFLTTTLIFIIFFLLLDKFYVLLLSCCSQLTSGGKPNKLNCNIRSVPTKNTETVQDLQTLSYLMLQALSRQWSVLVGTNRVIKTNQRSEFDTKIPF